MTDIYNILDTPSGGGGGDLVLLDTQTGINVASLDFLNISQAYSSLILSINKMVNLTNNQLPQLRASTNGGSSFLSTSIYDYEFYGWYGAFQSGAAAAQNTFPLMQAAGVLGSSGVGITGSFNLYNYTDEAGDGVTRLRGQTVMGQVSTTIGWTTEVGGGIRAGAAVNGLRLFFGAGNLTGQARLYGVT